MVEVVQAGAAVVGVEVRVPAEGSNSPTCSNTDWAIVQRVTVGKRPMHLVAHRGIDRGIANTLTSWFRSSIRGWHAAITSA